MQVTKVSIRSDTQQFIEINMRHEDSNVANGSVQTKCVTEIKFTPLNANLRETEPF